ncbi:ribonuclease H-like domain-containing protein, partial [Lentinula edodes]
MTANQSTQQKNPLSIPVHDERTDIIYNEVLQSAKPPHQLLRDFYGLVYYDKNPISVYTDGSCLDNGKESARAGSGICFGLRSNQNISLRVPGPGDPTNNRAEAYAVLMLLLIVDPKRALNIYCDSTYVIRECCYWAGRHLSTGWKMSNGDLLKDICLLLKYRLALTRFIWVKGHSGIPQNELADELAKTG